LLEQVESGARRLRLALRARAEGLRRQLDRLAASAALRRPQNLLAARAQSVDYLVHRLGRAASGNAERRRLVLREAAGRLDAMSPLAVLARGYAVCLDERSHRVLVRADEVSTGARVAVALGNGGLRCIVDQLVADRSELIEEAKRLGIEQ
jgi:exodeoxyribonuclease VII large subunit